MSIAVGDVDTLMPYPFCDAKAVNPMSISRLIWLCPQIMYANAFLPQFLYSPDPSHGGDSFY